MARQLAAGLVVGVMGVSIALSLATLVFRGDFADDLDHGIAWALVGLLTLGLVAALGSSIRGMAAGPQDVPSVVLAGVAVELGRVGATLPTLAAVVIVASTVTGITMVAVGRQRLGGLVRFVPYSVMAAFLGGTGVVLIMAGWSALSGGWPMAGFGLRLVPGLVLAVALVWAARGGAPAATGAVLIGMGLVGYHLAAAVAGIDPADAVARGLVLGPFPSGSMFDPGVLGQLGQADWGAVLDQAPAIIVLGILTLLGMLLNLGGLEHELDRDVDIDRELEANGAGVLLAAPLGGLPGFVLLGNTLMARRLGGASRVPPVIAAGLALVVLAVGADVLTLVPVLITGGVLVTIGLDFVITWLWEVRHRVGIVEHG
ncbi:MAG TPA: SulP family inorganic anion transporter, partial [Nitriliruptoraceae bacterium]|nr:SulP family inorganic anion transporter [Nitriliruptoraceae bacterium]